MRSFLLVLLLLMAVNCAQANQLPKLVLAGNISVPYVIKNGRHYEGADIDLARELAKRLGLELVIRDCPLARCFKLLQLGQIDMIMGLMFTEDRTRFLTYIEPHYFTSQVPLVFYFHRDRIFKLDNYEDLAPLAIGVERGVKYFERFDNDTKLKKVVVTEQDQMVNMLLKKRIDTIIEREESIIPLVDNLVYQRDLVKANYKFTKDTNGYMALSKKSVYAKHLDKFSNVLSQMKKEGTIRKIFRKYGLYHD